MLEIGFVSDELAGDFREAVRIGLEWGVRRFEIRNVHTGRIPSVERSELMEMDSCIRSEPIVITAVSPGIFKRTLADTSGIEHDLADVLPRSIELASRWGAGTVIAFGFERSDGDRIELAAEYLHRAAEIADRAHLILAVENETGFLCDSGLNTRNVLRIADHPALRANWDPCNAYGCGEEPYPDGYRAIRDLVSGVHAKDTRQGSLVACVPIGDGVIDWQGQIASLIADGTVRVITIETHCEPLIGMSRRNHERVLRMIETATTGAERIAR